MSAEEARDPEPVSAAVVQAVSDFVAEFAYRVDHERGMTVPELFSVDGVYEQDGQRSTGRDAIRATYVRRASLGQRTARHLFTNLRVRLLEEGVYAGTSIMLLFAENGEPPLPAIPLLVADVDDRYEVDDGGVLLRSRVLTSVFVRPGGSVVLPLGEVAKDGAT